MSTENVYVADSRNGKGLFSSRAVSQGDVIFKDELLIGMSPRNIYAEWTTEKNQFFTAEGTKLRPTPLAAYPRDHEFNVVTMLNILASLPIAPGSDEKVISDTNGVNHAAAMAKYIPADTALAMMTFCSYVHYSNDDTLAKFDDLHCPSVEEMIEHGCDTTPVVFGPTKRAKGTRRKIMVPLVRRFIRYSKNHGAHKGACTWLDREFTDDEIIDIVSRRTRIFLANKFSGIVVNDMELLFDTVYPTISRANHSHCEDTMNAIISAYRDGTAELIALRDIDKDEEIMLTYSGSLVFFTDPGQRCYMAENNLKNFTYARTDADADGPCLCSPDMRNYFVGEFATERTHDLSSRMAEIAGTKAFRPTRENLRAFSVMYRLLQKELGDYRAEHGDVNVGISMGVVATAIKVAAIAQQMDRNSSNVAELLDLIWTDLDAYLLRDGAQRAVPVYTDEHAPAHARATFKEQVAVAMYRMIYLCKLSDSYRTNENPELRSARVAFFRDHLAKYITPHHEKIFNELENEDLRYKDKGAFNMVPFSIF